MCIDNYSSVWYYNDDKFNRFKELQSRFDCKPEIGLNLFSHLNAKLSLPTGRLFIIVLFHKVSSVPHV